MDHQHCINYLEIFLWVTITRIMRLSEDWRRVIHHCGDKLLLLRCFLCCFLVHNKLRGCPSYRRVQICLLCTKKGLRQEARLLMFIHMDLTDQITLLIFDEPAKVQRATILNILALCNICTREMLPLSLSKQSVWIIWLFCCTKWTQNCKCNPYSPG